MGNGGKSRTALRLFPLFPAGCPALSRNFPLFPTGQTALCSLAAFGLMTSQQGLHNLHNLLLLATWEPGNGLENLTHLADWAGAAWFWFSFTKQ